MNRLRLRTAPRLAIVGSSSPVGKELKELIQESSLPAGDSKLLDTESYAGLLQEFAGQIEVTQIITPTALDDVDIAFFTCSPPIMNAYLDHAATLPGISIDLTQTGHAGTIVLHGVSDSQLTRVVGGSAYFISPHPAAIVLARVLGALQKAGGIAATQVTILEPASERGAAAIEELQEQTVKLLNFQTAESKIFKGQLAFNVLPENETAGISESLVRRQLEALLGADFPPPALLALQVPVFHSESFGLFVRFNQPVTIEAIRQSLAVAKSTIVVSDDPENPPSPVSVIGSDQIHVGRITADAGEAPVYSFWITADNLRIAATNALGIAQSIMLHD